MNYLVAVLIWLVFVFIARNIHDKANKTLDQDKKAALIDLFSKGKVFSFGSVIVILVLFFLVIQNGWLNPILAYSLYFILLIGSFCFTSYQSYSRLKENQYPDSYIKSYLLSTAIRFFGLVIFFALLLSNKY